MDPNQPRKIVFNAPGMQKPPVQPSNPVNPVNPTILNPLPAAPTPNPAFRSFAHDIKSNVSEKGVSMAQIVMEEERRKQAAGMTSEDITEAGEKSKVMKFVLIFVAVIAILGGAVALYFTFLGAAPVAVEINPSDLSPIRAQKVVALELKDGYKNTLLDAVRGVAATRIPTETFVELQLREISGTTTIPVTFPRLMEILGSYIPDELLRSIEGGYAIGMYGALDENVPFIMFNADAFENAYIGMKEWEKNMIGDIGGIFLDPQELSVIIATSTPSLFQDKVYYNRDTRTVFGNDGKPALLWTIVNRRQAVITKNGETLDAIMKRITLENITR